MNRTGIEYLDYTWNITHGCSHSGTPGCDNCWALAMSKRLAGIGVKGYDKADPFKVTCCPEKLDEPLKIKKASKIGVSFMSDLFHEDIKPGFIEAVFNVMCISHRHTFLLLTKRPERMERFLRNLAMWPYPNVWLGVSVENQQTADERIPVLLSIPAKVRFVSAEPMLGEIDLRAIMIKGVPPKSALYDCLNGSMAYETGFTKDIYAGKIDWVIAGGESGPNARPMHPDWVCSLRDQCVGSGVPFFFKQWGEWAGNFNYVGMKTRIPLVYEYHRENGEIITKHGNSEQAEIDGKCVFSFKVGKKKAGHLLDSIEWRQYPTKLEL